ncbi:MAG: glycosyltransferase, partial [Thermoanaerobaculia bacterium]|nr:glycosyltransferase [Thermoanaerobaculia bacterium]
MTPLESPPATPGPTSRTGPPPAAVTVVLPTYNEARNIRTVIAATQVALRSHPDHEILVVDDDSPDGTWRTVDELSAADPRIHCYRRLARHGLASAILEGLSMASGAALVVMDADLQHDPAAIPLLVGAVAGADIAVGGPDPPGGAPGGGRRGPPGGGGGG